jgi:hypothetical protein
MTLNSKSWGDDVLVSAWIILGVYKVYTAGRARVNGQRALHQLFRVKCVVCRAMTAFVIWLYSGCTIPQYRRLINGFLPTAFL